jgi:hypothetical protein
MDVDALGEFLRIRRARTRPADVAMRASERRRVTGLRRDEVAWLAGISLDYYTELEQARGTRPSARILAALARALRLSAAERRELFALAGRAAPAAGEAAHIHPALLGLLDRLADAPALVVTSLHEVLVQNALSIALVGDRTAARGLKRSFIYQWFADTEVRQMFPEEDHRAVSRMLVSDLRRAIAWQPGLQQATRLAAQLRERSELFTQLWMAGDEPAGVDDRIRFLHSSLGIIELDHASFYTPDCGQRLLWFTAPAGSSAAEQLAVLGVIGTQELQSRPS